MRTLCLPLALAFVMVASCDRPSREGNHVPKSAPDRHAERAPLQIFRTPLAALQHLAELPAESQRAALTEHIYRVPDDDLVPVLESIFSHRDPAVKRELLTTVFEETRIRPALIRLPLLVELARQAEIEPSLRVSIMAELGTTLHAEHGESWGDWSLAVKEHLADLEGLLRVK